VCCGWRKKLINPELRNEKGSAPAPGAVFRALAENPDAPKQSGRLEQFHAQEAGREARPATPGAGVLPNIGIRRILTLNPLSF
jgi:hypothetical protein